MGSSRSTSSPTQKSLAFTDESIKEIAGRAISIDVANVDSTSAPNVDVNINGVDAAEVGFIVDRLAIAQVETARELAQGNKAVADIAKSATATQTEAGRLINQLSLPVVLVTAAGAAVFAFRRR